MVIGKQESNCYGNYKVIDHNPQYDSSNSRNQKNVTVEYSNYCAE